MQATFQEKCHHHLKLIQKYYKKFNPLEGKICISPEWVFTDVASPISTRQKPTNQPPSLLPVFPVQKNQNAEVPFFRSHFRSQGKGIILSKPSSLWGVFLKGPFPPQKKTLIHRKVHHAFPCFFWFWMQKVQKQLVFPPRFPSSGSLTFSPPFRKISLSFLKILMSLFQSQIYQQDSIQ